MNFKKIIFLFWIFFSFGIGFSFDVSLEGNYSLKLDEIKIYNVALNDSQVNLLYLDQLREFELDAVVVDYDLGTGDLDLNVTFPFIEKSSNLMCYFYYSHK